MGNRIPTAQLGRLATHLVLTCKNLAPRRRVELLFSAGQAGIIAVILTGHEICLALRTLAVSLTWIPIVYQSDTPFTRMVVMEGFEPPTNSV